MPWGLSRSAEAFDGKTVPASSIAGLSLDVALVCSDVSVDVDDTARLLQAILQRTHSSTSDDDVLSLRSASGNEEEQRSVLLQGLPDAFLQGVQRFLAGVRRSKEEEEEKAAGGTFSGAGSTTEATSGRRTATSGKRPVQTVSRSRPSSPQIVIAAEEGTDPTPSTCDTAMPPTPLPTCELVYLSPTEDAAAGGGGRTVRPQVLLFVYKLCGQDTLFQEEDESGRRADVRQAFWDTVQPVLKGSATPLVEVAVVWAISDPRLLRAFQDPSDDIHNEPSNVAEEKPKGARPRSAKQNAASSASRNAGALYKAPTAQPAVSSSGDGCRLVLRPRLILFLDDPSGNDTSQWERGKGMSQHPSLGTDSRKPGHSRVGSAGASRKGRQIEPGAAAEGGPRSVSRNGMRGKSGARPVEAGSRVLTGGGANANGAQALFTCQSFAEFVQKQQELISQHQQWTCLQQQYTMQLHDPRHSSTAFSSANDVQGLLSRTIDGADGIGRSPWRNRIGPFNCLIASPPGTERASASLVGLQQTSPIDRRLVEQLFPLPTLREAAAMAVAGGLAETHGIDAVEGLSFGCGGTLGEGATQAKWSPVAADSLVEPVWAIISTRQKSCDDAEWLRECVTVMLPAVEQLAALSAQYNAWICEKSFTFLNDPFPGRSHQRCRQWTASDDTSAGGMSASRVASGRHPIDALEGVPLAGLHQQVSSRASAPAADGLQEELIVYEAGKKAVPGFSTCTTVKALILQAAKNSTRRRPIPLVTPVGNNVPLSTLLCAVERDCGLGTSHGSGVNGSETAARRPPLFPAYAPETVAVCGDTRGVTSTILVSSSAEKGMHAEGERRPLAVSQLSEHDRKAEAKQSAKRRMTTDTSGARNEAAATSGPLGEAVQRATAVAYAVPVGLDRTSSARGKGAPTATDATTVQRLVQRCVMQALGHHSDMDAGASVDPMMQCIAGARSEPEVDSLEDELKKAVMNTASSAGYSACDRSMQSTGGFCRLSGTNSSSGRYHSKRERQHVLQQAILLEMMRSAGLSSSSSPDTSTVTAGVADTMGLPYRFEEMLSQEAALHRVLQFCRRFGHHNTALLSHGESAGGEGFAAATGATGERCGADSFHRYWVAGLRIPFSRRCQRLWTHMVAGVPSMEQFTQWQRWLYLSRLEAGALLGETKGNDVAVGRSSCLDVGVARELLLQALVKTDFYLRLEHSELRPFRGDTAALSGPPTAKCPNEACHESRDPVHRRPSEHVHDVRLIVEGRQTVYPYTDALIEVDSTNYSRSCRYIKSTELTATLHFCTSPPRVTPSAQRNGSGVAGHSASADGKDTLPGDVAYLTIRFDDGLTMTCAEQPVMPLATSSASPTGINPSQGLCSISQSVVVATEECQRSQCNTADVATVTVPTGSRRASRVSTAVGKKAVPSRRGDRQRTAEAGRRRTARDTALSGGVPSDVGDEKAPPPLVRLAVPPPVGPDACIRLWTAACVKVGDDDHSAPTQRGPHPLREAAPLRPIRPLDITLAGSGCMFHTHEGQGMLWFVYSGQETAARVGGLRSCQTRCQLQAAEPILCVHTYEGADSILCRSMEREVRRGVEEASAAVYRFFSSGCMQVLFPNGSVLTRYVDTSDRCGRMGGLLPGTQVPDVSGVRCCDTLTLSSGARYVRQCTVENLWGCPSRNRKAPAHLLGRSSDFVRLACTAPLACHIRYDAMHKCEMRSREDGVCVVQYLLSPHEDAKRMASSPRTSAAIDNEAHVRVVVHADGTTISTFVNVQAGMRPASLSGHGGVSPVLAPLLEDAQAAGSACGAPIRWVVESAWAPRVFVSAGRPTALIEVAEGHDGSVKLGTVSPHEGNGTPSVTPAYAPVPWQVVFGDKSVCTRQVTVRSARGTCVPFLETVLVRPTGTVARVVHDSALVILEPADAIARLAGETVALAVGQECPVFDIALGGVHLVDSHNMVTDVRNLYSSLDVSLSTHQSSLECLLRQLVHPTYTPHRLPKAQEERMQRLQLEVEAQEREDWRVGRCPPLMHRLRDLVEAFIIEKELLRPEVLHRANPKKQHLSREPSTTGSTVTLKSSMTFSRGPMRTSTPLAMSVSFGATQGRQPLSNEEGTAPVGTSATVGSARDGVPPLLLAPRGNGKVVQLFDVRGVQEAAERTCAAEGASDGQIFLHQHEISGEPGILQLTLHRAFPSTVDGAAAPSMFLDDTRMEHQCTAQDLGFSSFFSSPLSGRQGVPPALEHASSPWLPPALQPPRRFLRVQRHPLATSADVTSRSTSVSPLPRAAATREMARTFLEYTHINAFMKEDMLQECQRSEGHMDTRPYDPSMAVTLPMPSLAGTHVQKSLQGSV